MDTIKKREILKNVSVTPRKILVILIGIIVLNMIFNILKFKGPVAMIWGGSSFLHLSIIKSIMNGSYPWQDPHYFGEISHYSWLMHTVIAVCSRGLNIPLGYLYNTWPVFQVVALMLSYFWLGKTLRDEKTGLIFSVLILIARSTNRVILMPWPLYSSYFLVPLFIGSLYKAFKEVRLKYTIISGVILGLSLLSHLFTFLMLIAFSFFYFIINVRSFKKNITKYCAIVLIALLVSLPFWMPLYTHYGKVPINPTQEAVYKFKVYKESYPFAKDRNDLLLIFEDLILNKIVSKVEGGEHLGELNNILLFSLVVGSIMLILGRDETKFLNKRRILALSFFSAALFMRFHYILQPIIGTQFQPIRFTDFIEYSFVLIAGLELAKFKRKSFYGIVCFLFIFSIISLNINYYYNPNAMAARNPSFGAVSSDSNFIIVPSRDAKFGFLAETANELIKRGGKDDIILAHPVSALYFAGLTGRKFVALPQGFSNVFVDVDTRVNDAKKGLDSNDINQTIAILEKYNVTYIVTDPFIKYPEKFNDAHFEPLYEIKDVDYPNPWKKKYVGNVTIYQYKGKSE